MSKQFRLPSGNYTTSTRRYVSRQLVRYHGGKWKLAPWILRHLPAHRVYVEPFGGGGSSAATS